MNFIDAAAVEHPRVTGDGYLVADARVVRTGIQIYTGVEVGKPELATVRVYRPEAEVFSNDSLASFSHIPVTNDHPAEAVTADNWRTLAVGETSGEVLRDGHRLRIPLIVKDAAAVRAVQGGKRELSAGYTCDLAFEDGVTPEGETYDAIQKNIRANHLAIVQRGRAGSECRIEDGAAAWGAAPITPTTDKEIVTMSDALRTVVVDGLSVQTTDQGAQAIVKLQKDLESSAAKLTDTQSEHTKAIAAKDAELAKKDAEIDDLKDKVLDDAALDARVQARSALVDTARKIAKDVKVDGLSDAAIRKAVVTAKLGDAAVKDKADAYIDARFDILAEDVAKNAPDPVRQVLRSGVQSNDAATADEDKAYAASLADLNRKPEAA